MRPLPSSYVGVVCGVWYVVCGMWCVTTAVTEPPELTRLAACDGLGSDSWHSPGWSSVGSTQHQQSSLVCNVSSQFSTWCWCCTPCSCSQYPSCSSSGWNTTSQLTPSSPSPSPCSCWALLWLSSVSPAWRVPVSSEQKPTKFSLTW